MTIREQFDRRKKRVLLGLFACALTAMASAAVSVTVPSVFLVTLACVVGAVVVMVLAVRVGFRCPRCRGQWGTLAMYSGGVFSIHKDLRLCPYCGAELDG